VPRHEVERERGVTELGEERLQVHRVGEGQCGTAELEVDAGLLLDGGDGAGRPGGGLGERRGEVLPEDRHVGLVPRLEPQGGRRRGGEGQHHVVHEALPRLGVGRSNARRVAAVGARRSQPRRHVREDDERLGADGTNLGDLRQELLQPDDSGTRAHVLQRGVHPHQPRLQVGDGGERRSPVVPPHPDQAAVDRAQVGARVDRQSDRGRRLAPGGRDGHGEDRDRRRQQDHRPPSHPMKFSPAAARSCRAVNAPSDALPAARAPADRNTQLPNHLPERARVEATLLPSQVVTDHTRDEVCSFDGATPVTGLTLDALGDDVAHLDVAPLVALVGIEVAALPDRAGRPTPQVVSTGDRACWQPSHWETRSRRASG
jgi:hypothetical protein